MSTKSRKAIPLKEDIVQPTSFDLEKLSETMAAFATQLDSASDYFSAKEDAARVLADKYDNISYILSNAKDTITEVCNELNDYLD